MFPVSEAPQSLNTLQCQFICPQDFWAITCGLIRLEHSWISPSFSVCTQSCDHFSGIHLHTWPWRTNMLLKWVGRAITNAFMKHSPILIGLSIHPETGGHSKPPPVSPDIEGNQRPKGVLRLVAFVNTLLSLIASSKCQVRLGELWMPPPSHGDLRDKSD